MGGTGEKLGGKEEREVETGRILAIQFVGDFGKPPKKKKKGRGAYMYEPQGNSSLGEGEGELDFL